MARTLDCRAVIVTTGTFLRGLMHTGEAKPKAAASAKPPPPDSPAALHNSAWNWAASKPARRRAFTAIRSTFPRSSRSRAMHSRCRFPISTNIAKIGPLHCRRSTAGSAPPTSRFTRSSAPIFTAPRCTAARFKAPARAIAPASKTKSSALPTKPATRFSSNPKASTPTKFTATASAPRCRPTCRNRSSA